jgi:uncharacterized DUF497 family protein
MKSDDFEWDDAKAARNHRRHKITFEQARDVFADPFAVEWIDEGQDEHEQRFNALGMVEKSCPVRRLHDERKRDQDHFSAAGGTF